MQKDGEIDFQERSFELVKTGMEVTSEFPEKNWLSGLLRNGYIESFIAKFEGSVFSLP